LLSSFLERVFARLLQDLDGLLSLTAMAIKTGLDSWGGEKMEKLREVHW
jgi:hypothetical protein